MNDFDIIVWLLPVVFMLHDFEEIIFFRGWFERNGSDLERRFPKIAPLIVRRVGKLSTSGFTVAVAEEFLLLAAITLGSVLTSWYFLWLAAFMAFTLHFLVHIIQWIAVRRYIPAIGTTFPALTYCGWTIYVMVEVGVFSLSEIALWAACGVLFMASNLILAHKLAARFDRIQFDKRQKL